MSFTLQQRFQTLTFLNQALWRTDAYRDQYSGYGDGSEFYRFDATLTPTEYQKNRPVPLVFQQSDIWSRMDMLEATSEYLVQQVQSILQTLENVEKAITAERSSPNAALVKADVLEWDVGRRTAGMYAQRDESIEQLRNILGLPPSPNDGGGMLLRS